MTSVNAFSAIVIYGRTARPRSNRIVMTGLIASSTALNASPAATRKSWNSCDAVMAPMPASRSAIRSIMPRRYCLVSGSSAFPSVARLRVSLASSVDDSPFTDCDARSVDPPNCFSI